MDVLTNVTQGAVQMSDKTVSARNGYCGFVDSKHSSLVRRQDTTYDGKSHNNAGRRERKK